jgi:hypothetical protein
LSALLRQDSDVRLEDEEGDDEFSRADYSQPCHYQSRSQHQHGPPYSESVISIICKSLLNSSKYEYFLALFLRLFTSSFSVF